MSLRVFVFWLLPLSLLYSLSLVDGKSVADEVCVHQQTSLFCMTRRLQQAKLHRDARQTMEFVGDEEEEVEDPSCRELHGEYLKMCFSYPLAQAVDETRTFCDAFVQMCKILLTRNFYTGIKEIRLDFSLYCKKHKERFEYVCPEPTRFGDLSSQALDFCERYRGRCPKAEIPDKPVPFKPPPDRIWTREIKFWCDRTEWYARNFCTSADLLAVPRYAFLCGLYKYQCIDIFSRVIYG